MSTLKAANISNLAGTSTSMDNAINGSAKAWVNFNGTGTVAIRASYNVSSITDNGVGNYTVNLTAAMPDANYSAVGTTFYSSTGSAFQIIEITAMTASSLTVVNQSIQNVALDNSVLIVVHR